MKSFLIGCFVAALLACGCKKGEGFTASGEKPVAVSSELKLKIGVNGEIYANNKTLSQEEFMKELQRLKQSNGGVVYTRENPNSESTPAQSVVVDMLQQAQIPLKYSKE